jgi:hypothetical protein
MAGHGGSGAAVPDGTSERSLVSNPERLLMVGSDWPMPRSRIKCALKNQPFALQGQAKGNLGIEAMNRCCRG